MVCYHVSMLVSPPSFSSPADLSDLFAQPCALFLDFDGTLAELASTPDAVVIPPSLPSMLGMLQQCFDGALAIVSGRPVAQLDTFLAPLQLTSAGTHGAERRLANGPLVQMPVPSLAAIEAAAAALAVRDPRLVVERKHGAVALHYRRAPERAALCLDTMQAVARELPGVTVLHGKMVVEVKAANLDKGGAIHDFMHLPPFAGRIPVFIGDDVTDESGFAVVHAARGVSIKVGAGTTLARYRLSDPAAVHLLLAQLLI